MPTSHPPDQLEEYDVGQYSNQEILPALGEQEYLVNIYFTCVHPFFPVIHKRKFLEEFEQL